MALLIFHHRLVWKESVNTHMILPHQYVTVQGKVIQFWSTFQPLTHLEVDHPIVNVSVRFAIILIATAHSL